MVFEPWGQLLVGPIIRLENPDAAARLPAESLRFPISPNSVSITKNEGEVFQTKPPFPFSNCFHTGGSELHVRAAFRCQPDPGYKLTGGVRLSHDDHERILFSLPYDTIRGTWDEDDEDSSAGYMDEDFVRPGLEDLDASNWGDPIVDIWLQLDEQFSESCIPDSARNIGEEMDAVQR